MAALCCSSDAGQPLDIKAVMPAPTRHPMTRRLVIDSSIPRSLLPAAFFRPSDIWIMPKRNRPSPPAAPKIMAFMSIDTLQTDQADIDALRQIVIAAQTYAIGMVRYRESETSDWISIEPFTVDIEPVPEPATMLLLGSGIIGFAGFRKKFLKK